MTKFKNPIQGFTTTGHYTGAPSASTTQQQPSSSTPPSIVPVARSPAPSTSSANGQTDAYNWGPTHPINRFIFMSPF